MHLQIHCYIPGKAYGLLLCGESYTSCSNIVTVKGGEYYKYDTACFQCLLLEIYCYNNFREPDS